MHEYTREVELHLEPYVYVSSVDCWRPPQGEAAVGDLVEAGPLGIGQLLVLHTVVR